MGVHEQISVVTIENVLHLMGHQYEALHMMRGLLFSTANSLAKVASTNWYSMNHRATCFSPMYSTNLNRQGLTDQPSLHF